MIPRRLSIPNTFWKYDGLLAKHPGEMSFKCRRSVGRALCQKMRTPKFYVILKKIIFKGMNYMHTATYLISLNAYERLKYPTPVRSFTSYPISMFSILGLKLKLKSRIIFTSCKKYGKKSVVVSIDIF